MSDADFPAPVEPILASVGVSRTQLERMTWMRAVAREQIRERIANSYPSWTEVRTRRWNNEQIPKRLQSAQNELSELRKRVPAEQSATPQRSIFAAARRAAGVVRRRARNALRRAR